MNIIELVYNCRSEDWKKKHLFISIKTCIITNTQTDKKKRINENKKIKDTYKHRHTHKNTHTHTHTKTHTQKHTHHSPLLGFQCSECLL